MGLCQSTGGGYTVDPGEQKRQKALNRKLARELKRDHDVQAKLIKLLLLGAGESGKSTIFKQMKVLHKGGFSEEERMSYIGTIHNNVISSMKNLILACSTLDIPFSNDIRPSVAAVEEMDNHDTLGDHDTVALKELWKDPSIRAAYERRNEFQLNDSAPYFFKCLDKICTPGYIPSKEDVLRARIRTTGIVTTDFQIEKRNFQMYDVGGQRSERRKWIHCFDNVTAVMFVASLSEYDQVLFEDSSQNRMVEALDLFGQICNSKYFENSHIILFLNKKDLFEEKISRVQLVECESFSHYQGKPNDYSEGCEFIKQTFKEKCIDQNKDVFVHITCATNTDNISFVFAAVKDMLLAQVLEDAGVL